MPNEKKDRRPDDCTSSGLSRRDFIAFAAGFTAAAADTTSDRKQPIIDMDAEVKTPGIAGAEVCGAATVAMQSSSSSASQQLGFE